MPLCNLFHCLTALMETCFSLYQAKASFISVYVRCLSLHAPLRGAQLHLLDNLLVCSRRLLLGHTNVLSKLKHCPVCWQLPLQPGHTAGSYFTKPMARSSLLFCSVVQDGVYLLQSVHFHSVNSMTTGTWKTGDTLASSFCSVLEFLWPFKNRIWNRKAVHPCQNA